MSRDMATNYQDDFFGPIRVPILKSISRREVRSFLERYKKYHLLVTERARLANEQPQMLGIKICVSDKLLRILAKYEIGIPLRRLTDADVEYYLRKCLEPDWFYVPDLDRLFGRLRLRSGGDGRDRVTALFSEIEEIVEDNGLGYLPQKDIIKYM